MSTYSADDGPFGDLAAEGSGAEHDPEVAEAFAEGVGVDPTPEQIARYNELTGAADANPGAPGGLDRDSDVTT